MCSPARSPAAAPKRSMQCLPAARLSPARAGGSAKSRSSRKRPPQYANLRSVCVFEDSDAGGASASTPNPSRRPLAALSALTTTNTPNTPGGKTPGRRTAARSTAFEVRCRAHARCSLRGCPGGSDGPGWQGKKVVFAPSSTPPGGTAATVAQAAGDKENSHPNPQCPTPQHGATPGQKRKHQELEVRLGSEDAGPGSRSTSRRVDFQVRDCGELPCRALR